MFTSFYVKVEDKHRHHHQYRIWPELYTPTFSPTDKVVDVAPAGMFKFVELAGPPEALAELARMAKGGKASKKVAKGKK